jgi:hypothetical protein
MKADVKPTGLDGKDAEAQQKLAKLTADMDGLFAKISSIRADEGLSAEIKELREDLCWSHLLSLAMESNVVLGKVMLAAATGRKPETMQAMLRFEEFKALAEQLKRQGVRDPASQARERLAREWGFQSGQSLKKWFLRHR